MSTKAPCIKYGVRYVKIFHERRKFNLLKTIKSSHESLTSECYRLGSESATLKVHIYVDENKDIDKVFFYNPNKNLSKWLDKTLISRSNHEEEVNIEKSQEEQESNEVNSRSGKEKSWSQKELNKVEHTGSKEEQSKIEES
ncbi:MAG: hypothetical protein ACR5LB_10275 [Wolbachia sp.]